MLNSMQGYKNGHFRATFTRGLRLRCHQPSRLPGEHTIYITMRPGALKNSLYVHKTRCQSWYAAVRIAFHSCTPLLIIAVNTFISSGRTAGKDMIRWV